MEPQYTRRERRRSTTIAFFTLLFGAAFVAFVMIITGWGPLAMLAVLAGFGLLGLLHYAIWGRREEEEAEVERQPFQPPERR